METNQFLNLHSSNIADNHPTNIYLERMNKVAHENEGTLISTEWKGSASTYQFKDKEDRIFSIKYSHLMDRGWPKNVEKFLALSESFKLDKGEFLKKLSDLAIQNNVTLLSNEWLTTNDKYVFQFETGQLFELIGRDALKGKFPKDAETYFKQSKSRNKTKQELFNELKEVAHQYGGKTLSTEWTHAKDKYIFENQFGEQYEMSYDNFRRSGFPKSSTTKKHKLKK